MRENNRRYSNSRKANEYLNGKTAEELADEIVNDCYATDKVDLFVEAVIMAGKILEDINDIPKDKVGGYLFVEGKRGNECITMPKMTTKAFSATHNVHNMFSRDLEIIHKEDFLKLKKPDMWGLYLAQFTNCAKIRNSLMEQVLQNVYLRRRVGQLQARLDYACSAPGISSWAQLSSRRARARRTELEKKSKVEE